MCFKQGSLFIPVIHRDETITLLEWCMLMLIAQNKADMSNFVPTNNALAGCLGVKKSGASKAFNRLVENGYLIIKRYTDTEAYSILNKQNSANGCLFCGYDGVAIDKHHYPIREKDNGTETINICANCHREFHTLTDSGRTNITINWDNTPLREAEYLDMLSEGVKQLRAIE